LAVLRIQIRHLRPSHHLGATETRHRLPRTSRAPTLPNGKRLPSALLARVSPPTDGSYPSSIRTCATHHTVPQNNNLTAGVTQTHCGDQ
jgi:hypothetical protein